MGAIHHGVPKELVLFLKRAGYYNTFVETGTLFGESAAWAAVNFASVITIEAQTNVFERAARELRKFTNVLALQRDSAEFLKQWEPPAPTLFWLDAHWIAGGGFTLTAAGECPVLAEIAAINRSGLDHTILVDDARLFLEPPPLPHDPNQWPNIVQLIDALGQHDRAVFAHEDAFVAVPRKIAPMLVAHLQGLVTKAWCKP